MKGKIKKIVHSRNFGFIESSDGEEIFFHKSELAPGLVFSALERGQEVRYFIEETEKGKKATHIIKV